MPKKVNKILRLLTNRVFILFIGICTIFMVVSGKFYQLQVIEHDKFANDLRASVERVIDIQAPRGLIYDRYGRPLAINQPTHVIKLDQQVKFKEGQLNQVLLDVIELLEKNGDTYIDSIPISKSSPFQYTEGKTSINQFMYTIPYNDEKHRKELLRKPADEIINYLREKYKITSAMKDEDARKVIALRTEMNKVSFSRYKPVLIASEISPESIAYLEEHHQDFPGIIVDVEPVRYYPEGEVLGNVLGYTRTINESQYEAMQNKGYDREDVVGHEGIENTMEEQLRGKKGLERVEVDNVGRRVHTIKKDDAVPGNDVFLTIDLDLQRVAYASVEKRLSEALVERLKGGNEKVEALTSNEVIVSMLKSSQLNLKEMEQAQEGTMQNEIYNRLLEEYNKLDEVIKESLTPLELLIQHVSEKTGVFTEKEILLVLNEQKKLKLNEVAQADLKKNRQGSTETVLIEQFEQGNLKPNQMSVTPFSASAVVVDVNTGETLALVGYPSYDSNQMTTNFNRYYNTLFDERSMLWNRALMTTKAPGSTFKMITSLAGLEEGVVTPDTYIYDTGVYEKAGNPAPKCWIYTNTGGGHGNVNVTKALEVSCNYYMFDVAYRLGLKGNTAYGGIESLAKYAEMFGLNHKTGIELAETEPNISTPYNLVKNQLATEFNSIKNLKEEALKGNIEDITQELEKGIFPIQNQTDESLEARVEYMTQYELKRGLEPLLQEVFEDQMETVLDGTYKQLQIKLQGNLTEALNQVVTGTMNDRTEKSLRNKTKNQLMKVLRGLLDDYLEGVATQLVEEIDTYDILDAYDRAYNTIYNRQFKSSPDSDVVKELKKRMEVLDENEMFYKEEVVKKIKTSIINALANEMLNGLRLDWSDGTTVRTAIGQGDNAFTPVQMARYIAGLANEKTVYDLRIINGVNNHKQGTGYKATQPKVYSELTLKPENLEVVHQGMYEVTHGTLGSARHIFKDFEIEVAGKTGTAQEGTKDEHSWFVGMAPYDKPQIAIVTTIYESNGQGTYGQLISKDILTEYFNLEKEADKTTLDHTFVE